MSRARWSEEGRDWPNRASSRFVDAGRVRWHVQVMGAGPVVLLVHGTGAATHSWRDLAPLLAQRFTVVAPDLPGHGFTTGRPAGGLAMPALARALGDLLDALDVAPDLVVGHSAGAAIALRMVLDRRIRPAGVVGLSSALMPFPGLAAKVFPTLARMLFVNPFAPHLVAAMARGPGDAERFLRQATGSRIATDGVALYRALFATSDQVAGAITMMASWDLEAFARDLPKVTVPTLLIHGAADRAIPSASVRQAAALLPDSRVELLPGLGHLAHEERPADIAGLIGRFAEHLVTGSE
ncbi:alpha/beta fold hydrolase BchO [Sphingomonas sp. CARO-RG-8B-R24-01]|uniref:alpha/beta fold hydrolase BchO n=1 Tax=Sphingomonas sp. CARO-RG-8B-R24-01 TaxID=2914831 RepID=UPI001F58A05D|nr:alpha/beta fold hydrolase BchO [Sphingomonas sp. CARO-RG-8B-R24-01]